MVSQNVAQLALLDFLMGDSLAKIMVRYRLESTDAAEALLRGVLLGHGYAAGDRTHTD